MAKRKLSKRQEMILDALPWVHYFCEPRECTGWMRSHKRCKNPAHWRFTSKKSRAKWNDNIPNGVFCWSHLISRGIYGSMTEEARTEARLYEVGVLCQSISPNGKRCGMYAGHDRELHYDRCWTEPYSADPDQRHYGEEWSDADVRS